MRHRSQRRRYTTCGRSVVRVACRCAVRQSSSSRPPMMAERGASDGLSPANDEARSPAGGGSDWPLPLLPAEDGDDDETTDYRRRCVLLEASLVKFKEKATRVRQLFTVKVFLLVAPPAVTRPGVHTLSVSLCQSVFVCFYVCVE